MSQWMLFRPYWLSHKLLTVYFVEHLQTAASVMTLPSIVRYTPYGSLGVAWFQFLISTEIFSETVDMIMQHSKFASKDYFLIPNLFFDHKQQSLGRSNFFKIFWTFIGNIAARTFKPPFLALECFPFLFDSQNNLAKRNGLLPLNSTYRETSLLILEVCFLFVCLCKSKKRKF